MKYVITVSIFFWLLLLLLLTGCGSSDPTFYPAPTPVPRNSVPKVDEAVKEYVSGFKDICDSRPSPVCLKRWPRIEYITVVKDEAIRTDAAKDNWVGVCWEYTDSKHQLVKANVQILDNDGRGNPWDADSLKGIIYHELGHCALNLEHEDSPYTNPKMMNPSLYSYHIYANNWEKMVEEEFSVQSLALMEEEVPGEIVYITAHPFYREEL